MDEHVNKRKGAGGVRGRRRSAAERERLVQDFQGSGLTQAGFAAGHGLNLTAFRNWLYRPARSAAAAERGHFAPVRLVAGARPPGPAGAITVRWPHGLEVEIAGSLDGSGVRRLVRELVRPCLR